MKFLSRIALFFSRVNKSFAILSGLLIAWMMVTVTIDVALRKFAGTGVIWALQVAEYAMIGMTFAGAAWVLEIEGHVSMDFITNQLSPRTRHLLNFIMSILGFALCLVITWIAANATRDSYVEHVTYMSALRVPRAYVMFIIPVGTLLLSVQFVRRAYGYFRRWKE